VKKKVVKKKTIKSKANGPRFVIVRTDRAGVFFGQLASKISSQITLKNSRRLWYWEGAASLSQLAVDGTKNPAKCKFPAPVAQQELLGVIEVIYTTVKAQVSINGVPVWTA
jgi:hypothetical protein